MQSSNAQSPRIIVALDYPDKRSALAFVKHVNPSLCRLKIGKQLFTAEGPDFVREVVAMGFSVFLDLKYHDIPTTVAEACSAAAKLGVWMLNVHVSGGEAMLTAAKKALQSFPVEKRPLLIGVTVLTSLDESDLSLLGMHEPLEAVVLRLADLAKHCGLDGVVCSAEEASAIRKKCGDQFMLVTPGIRFDTDNKSDQKRVVTPLVAFSMGADYLVVGRSITQSNDPVSILKKFHTLKG